MRAVHRWVMATVGVLGAVACGAGSERDAGDPPSATDVADTDDCGKVAVWMEQHRANLPSAYAEIVRFPPQYRRAIFAAHSPTVESALWRTHLERYGQDHPLTSEQRAMLEHARAVGSPSFYAISPGTPDGEAAEATLRDLELEAVAAFGRTEAGVALAQLGPPETALLTLLKDAPATAFVPPFCRCSTQSDYCVIEGGNKTCTVGVIPCVATLRGCGLGFYHACNGYCT